MNWQAAQIEHDHQQRNENQSLQPVIRRFAFGEAAQFCGDAKPQNNNQNANTQQIGKEIQHVFGARIRNRLFIAFARQRVLFGLRRLRDLLFGGGIIRNGWL